MKILIPVLVWIVVFIMAFVVPRFFIEATGSGFTRGMNRLPAVAGLHCLGFIIAIATAVISYNSRKEVAKWLVAVGFVPIAIDLLIILLIFGLYLSTIFRGILA